MPTAADGFGLFDAPFGSGGVAPDFSVNFPSTQTVGGTPVSADGDDGGFFGDIGNVVGSAIGRLADFGANLFIFDELAERGRVSTTTNTTTNANAGGSQTSATNSSSSGSLIGGVPNEYLFIGVGILILLLLLMSLGKGKK